MLSNKDNDDIVKYLLDVDLVNSNIQKMLNNIENIKDFLTGNLLTNLKIHLHLL